MGHHCVPPGLHFANAWGINMAGHAAVCCKLPNGIVLQHPIEKERTVTLKGKSKAVIVGADYGTTMVDQDFWNDWYAANSQSGREFAPLKSGAIFVAKDGKDAEAKAKDFKERKTGFEGLTPKDHGVMLADKD